MNEHQELEEDIESGIEGEFEFEADREEDDLDEDGETLDSQGELTKLDVELVEVENPEDDPTIDTNSDNDHSDDTAITEGMS